VNTKLVEMPCRRAISVTTAPGASVSSMIRISARRRHGVAIESGNTARLRTAGRP
jgi:hypothetical protein